MHENAATFPVTPPTDVSDPEPRGAADSAARLAVVLEQHLVDLQAGRVVSREALLAAHPDLATQLDRCLAGIEFIHSAARSAGGVPARLGDFRILRELGRGGMGVVYEAEQISLKRRVALKVLRFGVAGDPEAQRRFQREAETIARLHHTHIVPIFAVGCEQGVHYFAMEYIEGRSLAETLDEARRAGQLPAPIDIARWGMTAAEALGHAHERGIIHRDVKPSNLLLDRDGRLWLTDFGLARGDVDGSLTASGVLLGTPRYMSPEQAGAPLPLDHRTDIYSLGITLYELATGQPAFSASTPHEVISRILSDEPIPPRRTRPSLPRDLETICLKCLQKDPAKRYQTAQELADDVRRHLAGEPIRARRISLREHAWRWAKRRPAVAALWGVCALSLVGLVLGILGYAYQKRADFLRIEAQRERALGHLQRVRKTIDLLAMQVVEIDLVNEPRMEQLRRQILERAVTSYEELLQEEEDDPAIRLESARVRASLARLYRELGKAEQSVASYEMAIATLRALVMEQPSDPDYRTELGRSLDDVSYALLLLNRHAQAKACSQEALPILRGLVREFPAELARQEHLARALYNLADLLSADHLRAEAESAYEECLKLREELVRRAPQDQDYRNRLAATLNNWSNLFLDSEHEKARAAKQRAVDLLRQLVHENPASTFFRRDLAACCCDLSSVYHRLQNYGEAEKLAAEGLTWNDQLVKQFPSIPVYRYQLGANYAILAAAQRVLGKSSEAVKALDQSIQRFRETVAEYPCREWLAEAHFDRGTLLFESLSARANSLSDFEAAIRESEQYLKRERERGQGRAAPQAQDPPKALETSDGQLRCRRILGFAHYHRGVILLESKGASEAEAAFHLALGVCQQLLTDAPTQELQKLLESTMEQLGRLRNADSPIGPPKHKPPP